MSAKCRSCPAPIMWATHVETKRNNPLDAEPSPEGNCEVRRGLHSTTLYYRMLTGEELERARAEGKRLYLSHFATCPNARRHRKKEVQLRRVKYLNNIIEQDHRFVKKRLRACLGYRAFDTAERTIQGVEAINMMRKGQVKRLDRGDAMGQAKFVKSLFGIAAQGWVTGWPSCLKYLLQRNPHVNGDMGVSCIAPTLNFQSRASANPDSLEKELM